MLTAYTSSLTALVVGRIDKTWGEGPVVLYKTNEQISINCLKKYCEEKLPKYMMPKFFIKINKIPMLNNKKINYNEINDMINNNKQ